MEEAEIKQAILEWLDKKSKSKKMHYMSDIAKGIGLKKKEIKKVMQDMLQAGELDYWSSGSTTYYMLPGARDTENV